MSRGPSNRMRGLGDATLDPSVNRQLGRQLASPPATTAAIQNLSPASLQQMQQAVHQQVSSQQGNLVTFDPTQDTAQPMPSASFSVEGALPGGVAFLLAGALGLLGASFVFGGK